MVALNEERDFKSMDQALHFDPLASAEKISGKSYKEDEQTGFLGMALAMGNNMAKDKMLQSQDDVSYSSSLRDYCRILKELGFKLILTEPFDVPAQHQNDIPRNEVLSICWHPEKAILCVFDSYQLDPLTSSGKINSAHWYFTYKPTSVKEFYDNNFRVSGQWHGFNENDIKDESNMMWIGNWNAREAIRYQMKKFDTFGLFINPWPKCQLLQLNNYMDWKECKNCDYSYPTGESIRRFNLLPEEVRIRIKGTGCE
jgi:hypothetical protein